jgi:UDP-GlcNAc:undecaprenyl-phosphate GlcNAc-1-phosphate transferase
MLAWLILGAVIPSALACWLAAWGLRWLAPRVGLVDRPGGRKAHDGPVPTGGGLAIWIGLALPLGAGQALLAVLLTTAPSDGGLLGLLAESGVTAHFAGLWQQSAKLWMLLGGGAVLMVLGLADDCRGLDWRLRLAAQTAVAGVMVSCGWCVRLPWDLPGLAFFLSVVWIVGLVNSFNMLDNMDGLSAGVAAIAAAILAAAVLMAPRPDNRQPQLFVAGFLLVVVGSLLGFLAHNRPPARLFMGDTGSYLIGYLLAMATLTGTFAGGELPRHGDLAPLCAMAVPIYDTASVIFIRLRQGRSPFVGDKSHFSHRLVRLGMTKPQAVLTIYLATATCGLGALLLHQVDVVGAILVLLVVACTLLLIGVLERAGSGR